MPLHEPHIIILRVKSSAIKAIYDSLQILLFVFEDIAGLTFQHPADGVEGTETDALNVPGFQQG